VDAKPFAASLVIFQSRWLLLLLLLLARFQHSSLRQLDCLAQDVEIADVVGENEHQSGVEIGAGFIAQSAMGFDDRTEGIVRLFEVRAGD
jgi:hypothetical protein